MDGKLKKSRKWNNNDNGIEDKTKLRDLQCRNITTNTNRKESKANGANVLKEICYKKARNISTEEIMKSKTQNESIKTH